MKEKSIYICDICGGSYSSKEMAEKCELLGYPEHYNEFVGKWIILPIQTFENEETLKSSKISSIVEWYPVRVEKNAIVSPSSVDFFQQINIVKMSHILKLTTRSFKQHFVLKEFLDYAIIVSEENSDRMNKLLVEHELSKINNTKDLALQEISILLKKILDSTSIPPITGIEKYEYNSNI